MPKRFYNTHDIAKCMKINVQKVQHWGRDGLLDEHRINDSPALYEKGVLAVAEELRQIDLRYKHSDADIAKLRKLFATGKYTQRQLAEMFGMADSTVSTYVNNKRRVTA